MTFALNVLSSILLFVVTSYVIYQALDKSGIVAGFIVSYIMIILENFILYNFKIDSYAFISAILPAFVTTWICNNFYDRTNSFREFLKRYIILVLIVAIILVLIAVALNVLKSNELI